MQNNWLHTFSMCSETGEHSIRFAKINCHGHLVTNVIKSGHKRREGCSLERETSIAEGIRTMDQNAQYDVACKRLLSEKIILAWILKCCTEEFRDIAVNEIVEKYIEGEPQVSKVAVMPDQTNAPDRIQGIGTEDALLTEGTVYYDIRFVATAPVSGELIRLIINLEAQNVFNPGYPLTKRGIFYCSRNISAQYGTEFSHSNYQDIKKVYSIWVAANPPVERQNTITRYRITEENVIGNVKEPRSSYDLMTMLIICLGKEDDTGSEILRLLNVLLSRKKDFTEKKEILQEEFAIPMTESLERRLDAMCNLSEGVYAEGIVQGVLVSIKSLMQNTGWPVERAMMVLNVPEQDRAKYAAMLENA